MNFGVDIVRLINAGLDVVSAVMWYAGSWVGSVFGSFIAGVNGRYPVMRTKIAIDAVEALEKEQAKKN